MPRGGKRPGAGAPRGNLNALKHGRRSRQMAELGALIAQSPTARNALLAVNDQWEREKKDADYVATRILVTIIKRGLKQDAGGLIVNAPDADGRSIIESALEQAPPRNDGRPNFPSIPADNQKPSGPPPNNQPQIRNRTD